jgi:hypothetical protein
MYTWKLSVMPNNIAILISKEIKYHIKGNL